VDYQRELLKGNTEAMLLSLLNGKAMYGYEMVKEIEKRSNGYFKLKEGTLYPALHRLEKNGFVTAVWQKSVTGPLRRYYELTPKGVSSLERMSEQWRLFSNAVSLVVARENL
jgi:PadR family transcriptional regulator PadR